MEVGHRKRVSKIFQLMHSFIYSIKLYLVSSEYQALGNQR